MSGCLHLKVSGLPKAGAELGDKKELDKSLEAFIDGMSNKLKDSAKGIARSLKNGVDRAVKMADQQLAADRKEILGSLNLEGLAKLVPSASLAQLEKISLAIQIETLLSILPADACTIKEKTKAQVFDGKNVGVSLPQGQQESPDVAALRLEIEFLKLSAEDRTQELDLLKYQLTEQSQKTNDLELELASVKSQLKTSEEYKEVLLEAASDYRQQIADLQSSISQSEIRIQELTEFSEQIKIKSSQELKKTAQYIYQQAIERMGQFEERTAKSLLEVEKKLGRIRSNFNPLTMSQVDVMLNALSI